MRKVFRSLGLFVALILVVAAINLITASTLTPSRGSSVSSWSEFVAASPFSANYVQDRPRVWLPVSGGGQMTVASLVGLGAGTPSRPEINSSEISGFTLDADNESWSAIMPIPADADLSKDIRLRVLWSNSEAAGTGSAKFICYYDKMVAGTTAIAVANDTFDSNAATQADLAANVMQWSPYNTISGGTISATQGDDLIIFRCKVDLTTIADATVYGMQVDYYRKFLGGDQSF